VIGLSNNDVIWFITLRGLCMLLLDECRLSLVSKLVTTIVNKAARTTRASCMDAKRYEVCFSHRVLKIDQQLRLPQRHCLQSRDDSIIAYERFSIFSYFFLFLVVYTACILNYTNRIAVFDFFLLIIRYLDCCQRSLAVVKAVAELKIDRRWL